MLGLCVWGEGPLPLLDGDAEGGLDGLVDGEAVEGLEGDADGAMLNSFDRELVGLVDTGFIVAVELDVTGEELMFDGEEEDGGADGCVDDG